MEAEKLSSSWEDICTQIKSYENIDVTQVNAFFSRLHPQAMSEGFLMITADNEFIKTWIERHYIEFIKKATLDIYNTPFTIIIEVDVPNTQESLTEEISDRVIPQSTPQKPQFSSVDPVNNKLKENLTTQNSYPLKNNKSVKEIFEEIPDLTEQVKEQIQRPTSSLTFENFVIGDSNRIAYSMAVAVSEMPGKAHLNPLFIYGKSGLGKTHLLRAIQNYISETLPHLQTVYVDSAELLSDYTDASAAHDKEKSSYKNFKTKYEDADVLLIDDVQYLQGKKQTLDIVFQIFNKLTTQGRQVILSADRAPKNIDIDERYISRFNSGGTFDIQPPEIETKLGIVKSFIEEYKENEGISQFSISDEIQIYIAENSSSNIRELKSAVTKVIYQITFLDQPDISLDDVKSLLNNHFSGGPSKRLTVSDIQKEVEAFYKISHADLVGTKRSKNIVHSRQVAMYLCRQLLDIPYGDIGKKFSKDHSTAMYSVSNVEAKIKENREIKEEIDTLKQIIREI